MKKRKTNRKTSTPLLKDIISSSLEEIERLNQKRKDRKANVFSGFKRLNGITGGFKQGELVVVAGVPYVGKTSFVSSIATYVASSQKKSVLFVTPNIRKEKLIQRMISAHSGLEYAKLFGNFENTELWAKIIAACAFLSELPLYIDDTPYISMNHLERKAEALKKAKGIELLIIDSLQEIGRNGKIIYEQAHHFEIVCSELKILALRLEIPVILVSDVKEKLVTMGKRASKVFDFGEPRIEPYADAVVFLYREWITQNPSRLLVRVTKNRSGSIGEFPLIFTGSIFKLEESET